MTCAYYYTITTFINRFVTIADDVPGEPQLAQADVKNRKGYAVEFKRRVLLLRHEKLGNIASVSRQLSVPVDDSDNDMGSQDIDDLFIEVLLADNSAPCG